jgi:hypothetical protein
MVRSGHMTAVTTASLAVIYSHGMPTIATQVYGGNWCGMGIAAQSFSWLQGSGDTTGVAKQTMLVSPTKLHETQNIHLDRARVTSPYPRTVVCHRSPTNNDNASGPPPNPVTP